MKKEDEILSIVKNSLDDGKAEDVTVIDLRGKTSIANEMVVASGTSDRHVISLAQRVQENLKNAGYKSDDKLNELFFQRPSEEYLDYGPEVREYYNLEKMWKAIANMREE